jgi:hypothetical protein
MSSSFFTWMSMFDAVQATVLRPIATRKGISKQEQKHDTAQVQEQADDPQHLLVPPSSPFVHRARAASRSASRRSFSWPGQRPRRVMLASVVIDAIDPALDVVSADAAVVVVAQ